MFEELLSYQIGAKDVLINDFHKTNKSIIRKQLLLLLPWVNGQGLTLIVVFFFTMQ